MSIDALPNDLEALRALVSQLSSERDAAVAENRRLIEQNDNLRHLLKKLQNAQFGKKSERLAPDQLQLAMEDLETAVAKQDAEEEKKQAAETPTKPKTETKKKRRPNRGSLPAHLPRIHVTIEPESTVCPCCEGQMHMISDESVSTRFRPNTASLSPTVPNMAAAAARTPWSRRLRQST